MTDEISFFPIHHEPRRSVRSSTKHHAISSFHDEPEAVSPNTFFHRGYWWWPFAAMLLVAVTVIGRLWYLQIAQGATYRARAEQNRIRTQYIPAPRGSIYDRNGKLLVENIPDFAVTVTPVDIPTASTDKANWYSTVEQATGLSHDALQTSIKETKGRSIDPVIVMEHVPEERALSLMVTASDIPGLAVEPLPTRQYDLHEAAASILGYIGPVSQADLDQRPELRSYMQVGKSGLERQYDSVLLGSDGYREVERDVHNQQQEVLHEQAATPGHSLKLTIDANLQQHLYDALSQSVKTYHSTGGAAIAMNPQNGEVLAMVTAPTYDDTWFVTGGHDADVQKALTDPSKLLLNRAIGGQYPSGSLIKPLLGVAGLAEGLITPNTTVLSTGGIKIGSDTFPDWKAGGHGITNLSKAIADSVNTYFYILGGGYQDRQGLGVDRIVSYLQRFGWGSRLGIDLPGEAAGFLPTKDWRDNVRPSPWRLGDTYHLSIGQGDLQVTPLQIVTAMSAIANGGTLYQPHLVSTELSPDGKVVKDFTAKVIRSLGVKSSDVEAVRSAMRQGVLNGSSRALQSLPVAAAGKTGTAQFGNQGKTHSWYTAFAPYDHPTIAIAVIVEGGGEGNTAALPVANSVLNWYFTQDAPAQ